MVDKIATTPQVLDENTRRYYLDAMGIQCWQLLTTEVNTDVTSQPQTSGELTWLQLESNIQRCTDCALHQTRKQALVGRGSKAAELMLVLLAPSVEDDASGLICSGEGNALLKKMLAAINISIDEVYITALLKCAIPPNHTVSPAEIRQCRVHLKQQVQAIQPRLIVILGEVAAQCLLKESITIDEFRENCNSAQQSAGSRNAEKYRFESVRLFISYSPDELVHQPENKRKAWVDLQALQKIVQ